MKHIALILYILVSGTVGGTLAWIAEDWIGKPFAFVIAGSVGYISAALLEDFLEWYTRSSQR